MKTTLAINIEINPSHLARENREDDLLEFINEIDEARASTDFTLSLIKKLVKSLETDMSIGEIKKELGF